MVELEIKNRLGLARICKVKLNKKEFTSPNLAIVVNPNQKIDTKFLKRKNAEILMTNAFLLRNKKEKNVKKLFNWNKVFFIDSGAYQMFSLNITNINEKEILKIEEESKGEVIAALDTFVLPSDNFKIAKEKVLKTINTSKNFEKFALNLKRTPLIPIQGGLFKELRKLNCEEVRDLNAYFGIGGIVPLMMEYKYKDLFEILLFCKLNLKFSKPIHCFGAGHPMLFSFLVFLGIDTFDSAMYSLSAKEDRYLTSFGTLKLEEIEEFPCDCEICSKFDVKEVKKMEKEEREEILTKHNLLACLRELKIVREAIYEQRLFELCLRRAKSHPKLYEGFSYILKKYGKIFEKFDNFERKKGIFVFENICKYRSEFIRAKKRIKGIKAKRVFNFPFVGEVPLGLKYVFPFSQTEFPFEFKIEKDVKEEEQVKQTLEYQFGKNASKYFKNIRVKRGKTGLIRYVYVEGKLAGTFRARDGFFIPTFFGASLIKKSLPYPKNRVVVKEEAVEFVKKGYSVFCKFVLNLDKDIKPYQEVFIVDKKDNLIACGKSMLSAREILEFERGVAVKVRHGRED